MSSNHSMCSYEKDTPLSPSGTHKVKYHPHDEWDFHLDTTDKPIDLSLALPHYRARNQPVEHRMNMFIAGAAAPIKVKVCRHYPRSKFCLEIQAGTSDVTVWLPSDFKGQIHHSGRATFSAGFINRVIRNVRFNDPDCEEENFTEDDVVVCTRGRITFRMWDIQTCAPENPQKETLKRMFGYTRKAPQPDIDWDFLLDD